MKLDDELIKRLRANSEELGDCWEWRGCMQHNGTTPMMRWRGVVNSVRRVIAEQQGHDIAGKIATYGCGTPTCVNPDHTIVTTRKRVQKRSIKELRYHQDPVRNKRLSDLMRLKRAKLTPEIAEQIRCAEGRQKDIGKQFGVSQTTVSVIKRGKTWKTYSSPWAGLIGGAK